MLFSFLTFISDTKMIINLQVQWPLIHQHDVLKVNCIHKQCNMHIGAVGGIV